MIDEGKKKKIENCSKYFYGVQWLSTITLRNVGMLFLSEYLHAFC